MPSDAPRGDSGTQVQSSLRQALACFPKPTAAESQSAAPPHAAPTGIARVAPPPGLGPPPGYMPQEHLQLVLGSLRERQLSGAWRSDHAANQQPKRAGSMVGSSASTVANVADNINQNGSQVGSDSSGQWSQISTGYIGSSSNLSNSFNSPMGPGIACPEEASPGSVSSLGASLHKLHQCTPCKFIRSLRGCRDGSMCKLCHEPHEELTRSGVRKAARTKALQRRAMLEMVQVAATVPGRLPETNALDNMQASALPGLRDNTSCAPWPSRTPSVSLASMTMPGNGAMSNHGPSEGPPSYCQVFSF